ncbi:MAG: choice-of-anchor D domain-containing protein [Deltaproteobacteria bacterium]|nr:choice-of-anchor D domain-containing protein [Deltaproteobacteria bacterium]
MRSALIALLFATGCDKRIDPEPDPTVLTKPVLKIAPIELGFGAVEVHSPGAEASFQMGNAGTGPVRVLDVALTGEGQGFSIDGFEPLTLEPGEQTTVDVRFAPPVAGTVSGTVTVVSDDPERLVTKISLQGSGSNLGDDPGPTDPTDQKLDVFLLLDTAYSYSCYHPDLEHFAASFVGRLFSDFSDVRVGLGLYDDYVGMAGTADGSAASGGHPFRVIHLLSSDEQSLVHAAEGLQMNYGGDSWGSGYEALYQVALGKGLDMDCDHVYEPAVDILPFRTDENDAFGGVSGQSYDASVPGVGERAGVGWRTGAKHVVLIAADNAFRDKTKGGLPEGSCGEAAGADLAVRACAATDVRVLGINVYEYQAGDDVLQNQLIDLATRTSSFIDLDGDGDRDDPAVLFGSWDWPVISSVMAAVKDLARD